ncbi:MAG: hypothetical protein Q8916_06865 [Bacteroidota bacterium]|nr:hypothetical protein [Bacteroidota bacterium]MDP4236747.1 hypothetical protein [Bacteroidota bacterium]
MPDSIAERLSRESLVALSQPVIVVGSIYIAYFPQIGKEKFFSVAAKCIHDDNDLGVIVINSTINVKCNPTPAQQSLHIPITTTEYPFLGWDSFADCTTLFPISKKYIEDIISANPKSHKGFLRENHIAEVKQKIKAAVTITPDIKKRYGLYY